MTVMTSKPESQVLTSRARRRALARLRNEHQIEYEILYIAALQECRREIEEEQADLGYAKPRNVQGLTESGVCRPCLSKHHWRCHNASCGCDYHTHNGRPAPNNG